MDEDTKKEMRLLFNQGFEEVIVPVLDDMEEEVNETNGHIKGIRGEIKSLENKMEDRFDNLERKVDNISAVQLEHTSKLSEYDEKIKKLESKRAVV
jgi:predicted  nucleic acid-binding Zn-ribbon protein